MTKILNFFVVYLITFSPSLDNGCMMSSSATFLQGGHGNRPYQQQASIISYEIQQKWSLIAIQSFQLNFSVEHENICVSCSFKSFFQCHLSYLPESVLVPGKQMQKVLLETNACYSHIYLGGKDVMNQGVVAPTPSFLLQNKYGFRCCYCSFNTQVAALCK